MIKCPLCDEVYKDIDDVYLHVDEEHSDIIPQDFTTPQYLYFLRTKKEFGKCVVCGGKTKWNEKTNKYFRLCDNPKCRETCANKAKANMVKVYGQESLLEDPNHQKKMLANRKISGEYEWGDGTKLPYTGTYELDFLRFMDKLLEFDSKDIIAPSPNVYYYIYEGKQKFYMPDFFIPSLNLEIEIKEGNKNPNNHPKIVAVDKVKEKLKDQTMKAQRKVSYIKLVDKEYDRLFEFFNRAKEMTLKGKEELIFITESTIDENDNTVTESIGDAKCGESYMESANVDNTEYKPVYILLSYTGSTMAKVIKGVTHEPFSHAGVSFTSDLSHIYSFGRKELKDKMKFIDESIWDGALGQFSKQTSYSLYAIFLKNDHVDMMKQSLDEMWSNRDKYKYSMKGLLNVALNRKTEDDDRMFCSQFVAHIIAKGNDKIVNRHSSLYTPSGLRDLRGMHFITKGKLANYDPNKVENIIKDIQIKLSVNNKYTILESNMSNNETKNELYIIIKSDNQIVSESTLVLNGNRDDGTSICVVNNKIENCKSTVTCNTYKRKGSKFIHDKLSDDIEGLNDGIVMRYCVDGSIDEDELNNFVKGLNTYVPVFKINNKDSENDMILKIFDKIQLRRL